MAEQEKKSTTKQPKAEAKKTAEPATTAVATVKAKASYIRSSARKARLVADHIRGKSVSDARSILQFSSRAIARDIDKLLSSAVANAENNHDLIGDELKVGTITVDEGPTIKRFRPRAMGRATPIMKRTCHISLALVPGKTLGDVG